MGRSKSSAPAPDAALDPRWAAVLARDARADEQFVYAVRTTGIYCRASSVSRLPRPENVLFSTMPAMPRLQASAPAHVQRQTRPTLPSSTQRSSPAPVGKLPMQNRRPASINWPNWPA